MKSIKVGPVESSAACCNCIVQILTASILASGTYVYIDLECFQLKRDRILLKYDINFYVIILF